MSWWWMPWLAMLQQTDTQDQREDAKVTPTQDDRSEPPRAKTKRKSANTKRKSVNTKREAAKKLARRKGTARKSARKAAKRPPLAPSRLRLRAMPHPSRPALMPASGRRGWFRPYMTGSTASQTAGVPGDVFRQFKRHSST